MQYYIFIYKKAREEQKSRYDKMCDRFNREKDVQVTVERLINIGKDFKLVKDMPPFMSFVGPINTSRAMLYAYMSE